MNTQFNQSLAGTERKYVVGQVKANGTVLHIQIGGPEYNRPYGAAFDVPVGPALSTFLQNQTNLVKSLASYKKNYVTAQFDSAGGDIVKLQIKGTVGNRDYGFTSTIEDDTLASYLRQVTTQTVVKAVGTVAPMWDNDDDQDYDDQDDDDNENTNDDTAEELVGALQESLNSIQQLLNTANEELAQLKSKVV